MKLARLLPIAIAALATSAAAQGPIYIDLSPGSFASDVTVVTGPGGASDVVVVGTNANGDIFRWLYSTQVETVLGASNAGGNVNVSTDGTKLSATTLGIDGFTRAARYDGTTWTQGPSLGGTSGTSETTGYDISGDGQIVVGLGWMPGGSGHCYRWTPPSTATNLGGPFSDPASRANATNEDGSVIVGFKDLLNGTRQGARWVNGVLQPQFTLGGQLCGEATGVNASGSWIVGKRIFGGVGSNATAGWRWSANTVVPLANLAGESTVATPMDVDDAGSLIVGHSGGSVLFGTTAVAWVSDTPVSLTAYLTNLGTTGMSQYSDLGFVSAISGDGYAICGRGTGQSGTQPLGGWVVIFPGALSNGTPFCFGDGSGAACPCANSGTAGNGCASSVNSAGARLAGGGGSSISNDTLALLGTGMPNSSALYFQGTTQLSAGLGAAFGDGLRCAGGTVVRLGTKSNVAGASSYPTPGDASISVRGGVTNPGSVRHYQVWYRNAAAFCTASTFNLSNGLSITWGA